MTRDKVIILNCEDGNDWLDYFPLSQRVVIEFPDGLQYIYTVIDQKEVDRDLQVKLRLEEVKYGHQG